MTTPEGTIADQPKSTHWMVPLGIRIGESAATFAVLLLMGHTLLNVFMRYVFNSPVRDTNEIVAFWYMPLIAFSGFIIAQALDRHIAADLLLTRLPIRVRKEVLILGAVFAAVLCALLAFYTFEEAMHSMAQGRHVTGLSQVVIWPATFAAPVAYAVMTALLANNVVRIAQGRMHHHAEFVADDGYEAPPEEVARMADTPRSQWLARGLLALAIGGCIAVMFWPDASRQTVAIAAIGLMLVLLFLKIPVAFALAGPGLLGLLAVRPRAVITMLEAESYEAVSEWTLSVLPMFVFMGLLLWKSGLTTSIYVAARQWLGWLPGGLAVSTNTAGTGLAAVSGSTIGTTYALSRIGIPEMLKAGYDRRLAVGSVMVAGLPGQLIPPSTFLVVYAGVAEVPIGPQLMAGILPGLMISAVFSIAIIAAAFAFPKLVGRDKNTLKEPVDWSMRWRSLFSIWPLPVLIGIVLGGMYGGVLTATEAGSAGALGALFLTIYMQKRNALKAIAEAAVETVIATGSIFLLLIGATILSAMLTQSGVANGLATWVADANLDRVTFLLIVMAVYFLLGTFMEPLPMMLLTVPFLIPILGDMGVSPLWLGVFVVFMGELAILTPPVGILSFIIHDLVQDKKINLGQRITMSDVFNATWWFMPIALLAAVILILFPEIATFIPDSMARR